MAPKATITALLTCSLWLAGCASTSFTSTWKAPDARPMGSLDGKTVVALVLATNPATRRAAEDALARELTAGGATGLPSYSVLGDGAIDETEARAAIERSGAVAVVALRPVGREQEIVSTPTYAGPGYGGFWGSYWGYGWGGAYGTDIRTNTIVSVETLVFSLEQNKLIWAAQSRTTNPDKVDAFVREVITAAGKEMQKQGLL